MASDVDIVIAVATTGVADVYKLSNAMQQLNKVVEGVANPMYNLSARSKALSAAVGSADSSLKAHAKSVGQLARNNSVLTNELGRVRKEIAGMGKEYKFATDASGSFRKAAISDLKAYEGALKGIRLRALTEDLKGVAQEQKRLGKDAQFVGRSLIIGLTTPIAGFARYGLQALVSLDKEFVRLNKVLESVAPNLDAAAKKMAIDLAGATKEQSKQLQGMVDKYNALDKSLGKVSNRFGLAKSLTVGLAGDFAELGIQSQESIVKITELAAVTEKLGGMDIGAAKDLVQSLYFQAQRAMQMSGQGRKMTFEEREIAAIGAATAQLNLFNSVENVTALTLKDLGDAFPEVAAAGSSFGLSMTELASMLAPMKAAGFEVGASANSIKVSLQRLVAPTKQNAELFKELSKEYNTNFTSIKGTGLDAIQSLIDGFNELKGTAAGQEGAMEFFAKVFGVRQGPRMEVALAQMADFDEVLKSNTVSMDSAEKKLQSYANQAVTAANVTRDVNLPLIKSYKDIGIIARIATTQMKEGETRMIDGFGRVTMEQVKAARQVRQAVTDEIVKAQRTDGEDLIGQVNTEAGRAMFIQLAGAANAAEVAQRELDVALGSLDTQLSILKNNFKAFATDLIKGVRPAIEKITDISNKLITAWANLDERTKKLFSSVTLLIAGATAAIGPMIFVFGQFRLAMGSVAKVLFAFLPGLKTMSVDAVAGASAMLRLTKPLTVVGDTVVNTNNKFATFIATLASGDGPVSRLANKIGLMTGALQKQNTASMVLTRSVNRQKAAKIELAAVEGAGAILGSPPAGPTTGFKALSYAPLSGLGTPGALTGPRPGPLGVTARNLVARFGSDKPLRGATGPAGSADSVKNFNRAVREETFRLLEEAGFTKKNIGDMLRTPTSLTRTIVGPASDQARQNVQDAMGEIAAVTKGQRRFDRGAGLRQRFLDREQASILAGKSEAEAKKILNAQQVARQEAKGITTQLGGRGTGSLIKERFFKGVKIDDDTFDTVMGGGIKGRLASSKLNLGIFKSKLPDLADKGAGKFLGGKQTVAAVKGVATFGKDLFTQPTKALGDFVGLFKSGFSNITGVFGKIGPMFAKIGGYIKNPISLFMKFKSIIIGLGPAIMAAVSSFGAITGIGLIIGAIVAIVIVLVKNWDAFVAAIQPGIEALKDTFDILKDAVMGLVQPFLDFFNSIGGEGEGSNAIIATLATTFNILADVIKVLAIALKFVFVEIFGRIIKVALSSLLALLKGIGNFVMGLWKVIKGIFTFNWSSIVDGFKKMGKGIAQVAIGLMGPFADFFVFVLKGVKAIFDQLAKLPGWLGGGVFKKASQGIGAAISFVEETRNLKKGKGKGGKETPEVDTDPMQEQIANATGDGLKTGADEGAKELAKRAKQALKDLKKEVQEEIASRIKDAMNDVVDNIKEALKNQKTAALGIYDAQIKKIEDVGKAEERLTKEQEYQNKLREAEDQRALNRLNTRRSYAMAVYAGQIDEARSIADEGARQEVEDNKKVEEINKGRTEELAEQNRKDMIDSIKEAKEAASKYFDEMIESFTKAAKKITEFPPTTAEEFNTMLNMLVNGGDGFIGAIGIANSIGTTFSESFGGALSNLGADTKGPLTSALGEIGKVLTDNNPFGPTGIWNTTIDKTIDALTRKYQGLTNTLTTIIDTKSGSFQKLLDIYTKYQNLVNPAEGSGGSGSGGGGGGGNTNGGYGSGFNKDGVRVGNKVAIAAANADLSKIKTYSDKYLETKYGNTNEGKKLIAAIKGTVGSIASSSVLLGGHDAGMHDYMPIVLASKYKDQIRTNSELVYAYIVNNRSQFIKGAGAQGRTDESGRSGFFKGGMLQYGKGGATEGPVQQGIPAVLHGGEYVVRNSAVKRYGWGMMQQINQGTYKPKPFANGGMVTGRKGQSQDPAQAEWNWQQQNGGFSKEYLNTIALSESSRGDNYGKIPEWSTRVFIKAKKDDPKTKNFDESRPSGWMAGGLRTNDKTWISYGGKQFAPTADEASILQQMVVKNRIAIFGWIQKFAPGERGDFPAGGTFYNIPLGTGDHTFNRSVRKQGKLWHKSGVPLPENFNPSLSFEAQRQRDPFKNFGDPKGAFQSVRAKNAYVNYFENKDSDKNKITMPFSKPIWVRGKGFNTPIIKNDSRFDDFASDFYKGGLVKGKKPDEKKPASAADFRKADFLSAFEIQRIGLMAQEQAKEQKKGLFGKIKSAVAKPFVAAKNFLSDQFYSNLYGSQTGSGFTGSAVMLNRATNPKYEHVHPSGKPTMLDLPSVRAGAGIAKTMTEFNPITGAYFPLERTFDIHNEGLSGKDRTLAGLQSAVSLIGPDTAFGLDAPRNPSTFLPRVQESLSNSYWTFVNNNKPLNRIYSEARYLKDVIKPPTPTVDIAGRPIKVGPEAWFHYFDERSPMVKSIKEFNPAQTTREYPNSVSKFFGTRYGNKLGLPETPKTQKKIISKISDYLIPSKAFSNFGTTNEDWISMYQDYLKSPAFLKIENNRVIRDNILANIEEMKKGRTGSFMDAMVGFGDYSGELLSNGKRAIKPGTQVGIKTLIDQILGNDFDYNIAAKNMQNIGLGPNATFTKIVDLILNSKNPNQFVRTFFEQNFDQMRQMFNLPPGAPKRKSHINLMMKEFREDYYGSQSIGELFEKVRGREHIVDPQYATQIVNEIISRSNRLTGYYDSSARKFINNNFFEKSPMFKNMDAFKSLLKGGKVDPTLLGKMRTSLIMDSSSSGRISIGQIREDGISQLSSMSFELAQMYDKNYKSVPGFKVGMWSSYADMTGKQTTSAAIASNRILGAIYEMIMKPLGIKVIEPGSMSKYSYKVASELSEAMQAIDPGIEITGNYADAAARLAEGNSFNNIGFDGLPTPRITSAGTLDKTTIGIGGSLRGGISTPAVESRISAATKRIASARIALRKAMKNNPEINKFNGGMIPGFANGGAVPGFGSQGVPALLHGGEYVINSSAVRNIGIAALQAMNNMRFNTPKAPSYAGPISGQSTSTTTTHIYVENFIGEKQWFESMMKDYNITVAPQNQRAAGLNNSTISTYSGINRGL